MGHRAGHRRSVDSRGGKLSRLASLHGRGPLAIHRRGLVLGFRLSVGRYGLSLWALGQQRFYRWPLGLGARLRLGAVMGLVARRRRRIRLGAVAVGRGISRRRGAFLAWRTGR